MIGNQYYINHKVARDPSIPIDDVKIIEVINDCYWDEFKRLMNEAEVPVIQTTFLGTWYTDNRTIRSHARRLIAKLRKMRATPGFNRQGEGSVARERHLTKRLSTVMKQINSLRYLMIEKSKRYERYQKNKISISTQE